MRLSFIGSLLLAILLTIPGQADVVTIDFVSSNQYGSVNDTLIYGGTLRNTGSAVYINGADINIDSPFGTASYDLEDYFLVYAPLTQMADGDITPSFEFFTLTIPAGTPDGTYHGTLVVTGGETPSYSDDTLGRAPFTVQVGPADVSQVPKPGSFLMLGTALAALGMRRVLRWRIT